MLFDQEYFFQIFQSTPSIFEMLLSWVAQLIARGNIRREAIHPEKRLCVTLRYLITEEILELVLFSLCC